MEIKNTAAVTNFNFSDLKSERAAFTIATANIQLLSL